MNYFYRPIGNEKNILGKLSVFPQTASLFSRFSGSVGAPRLPASILKCANWYSWYPIKQESMSNEVIVKTMTGAPSYCDLMRCQTFSVFGSSSQWHVILMKNFRLNVYLCLFSYFLMKNPVHYWCLASLGGFWVWSFCGPFRSPCICKCDFE